MNSITFIFHEWTDPDCFTDTVYFTDLRNLPRWVRQISQHTDAHPSARFSSTTLPIQPRSITATLNIISLKCRGNISSPSTRIFSARIIHPEKSAERRKSTIYFSSSRMMFLGNYTQSTKSIRALSLHPLNLEHVPLSLCVWRSTFLFSHKMSRRIHQKSTISVALTYKSTPPHARRLSVT